MISSEPPETASLRAWLRLTLIPGIGQATQRKLLSAFGLPENIFSLPRSELRRIVPDQAVDLLLGTDNEILVDKADDWRKEPHQFILTLADPTYPRALLDVPDPPTLLYVRGRPDLLNHKAIAVVGSRNATRQGERNAENFAAALARAGILIVSGLALGIDAAAHRGALAADGNTAAFIGTGIDRVYPARNKALALEIAEKGTLVSEFPLGTSAIAANFPRRNRLISGISSGVLVVEATTNSGSLITARLAVEQGKEVFAMPGSIHSPQSKGCHRLIKEGAKLVETADDILEELRWQPLQTTNAAAGDAISAADNPVLNALGFDPCGLDELSVRTLQPADFLLTTLLQLEIEGLVEALPGGLYQRVSRD